MTIVASVKTRDCLVLGTDSVSTLMGTGPQGQITVFKSYPYTQKLFQLQDYSIGVATWGAGAIGGRSIAGLVADFGASMQVRPQTIQDAATQLNQFISPQYGAQFATLPAAQQQNLGFWVAGYSTGQAFSELWEVIYPGPLGAGAQIRQVVPPTTFGVAWNGVQIPFFRLQRGIDPRLESQLVQLGVSAQVIQQAKQATQGLEMQVIYDSMPVQQAIEFCRYVLNTTIGYNRFEIGSPLTGEPVQLALITQRNPFRWVEELPFHT